LRVHPEHAMLGPTDFGIGWTMTRRNPAYVPFGASALGGLLVCLAVSMVTGRREAWDSGAYFSVGIPIMCAVIFVIAYRFPDRPWRWALSMAAGQALALAMAGNSLSLWPLSLVAMTILSVPQFIIGSWAGKLAIRKNGD
jgi:O-antigen/teichoic acid export membrane protein